MAYSDIEALIKTQVQAVSGFDATNVTRANFKFLNKGKARTYAILRPGSFERVQHGMGGAYLTTWTTFCEVWVRYKDDGESMTELQSQVSGIISRFDSYPKAGDATGNVQDCFVRAAAEPEEMWRNRGDGTFEDYSEKQRNIVKGIIHNLRKREHEADRLEDELKYKVFSLETDPVAIFHLVKLAETVGAVADHAENAGDMMRAMIARKQKSFWGS